VYLVAENRLLRETLVHLFQKRAGISVLGEGRYADSTTERISATNCDVLLLDSPMTTEAVDLVDELRNDTAPIKVILFGMDENPDRFLKAVRLGIRGYLLKDASSAEVIAAVQGVVRGEAVCPPTLCTSLFELVSMEFRRTPGGADLRACAKFALTYRQRELLALVRRGLSNKAIAANLNLSEFTVRNHISRIMKQLNADTRFEAVDVIFAGSLLPPPERHLRGLSMSG
jgi:two-component system nitrate/nitrite response regulator NarL